MGKKFGAWYASEKLKLQGLTRKQKLEYILEYYWIAILAAVCLIAGIIYGIYRANFAVTDNWFYAIFANTTADAGKGSELWDDFAAYTGYDLKEKNIEFNAQSYFDPTTTAGTVNSYYEAFVAVLESGDLDVVTLPTQELEAVGSTGRLLDLTDERCASIYEKYQDRLVYCEPNDEDYEASLVPVGIDVSDSLLVTKYGVYEKGTDCALGISAYAEHMDAIELFLAFIFEE